MMRRVLTCALVLLALAGCGGADGEGEGEGEGAGTTDTVEPGAGIGAAEEYLALLEQSYTPVHDRFVESIRPCLARELKACVQRGASVREEAKAYLADIEGADVPEEVRAEHEQLTQGVADLDAAIARQHEAVATKDNAAFSRSISDVEQAIAKIDEAAHALNSRYRADLPTVH